MSILSLLAPSAAVATLAALLTLDTVALGQMMLSSPLISCSVVGWLLGNPTLGVAIGVVLTLPWLGTLPVGAFTPPDAPTAALTTTLGACLAQSLFPTLPTMVIAVGALLPAPIIATMSGLLDDHIYRINQNPVERAEASYIVGNQCSPLRVVMLGLIRFAGKNLLVILLGGWLLAGWLALFTFLPVEIHPIISTTYYAWLGLGLGTVFMALRGWRTSATAVLGLSAGLVLAWQFGGASC